MASVVWTGEVAAQPAGWFDRYIYFSGADLWRHGAFVHTGTLFAPYGLDQSNLLVKTIVSGGVYDYLSGSLRNARVQGVEFSGSILSGWRFRTGHTEIKVFAGLDLQEHMLLPDDPGSSLRGFDLGLRAAFDLWHEPDATSMVAADASVTTIGPGFSGRLAAGWRAMDAFYLGPETQLFICDDYTQWRVGLHATGWSFYTFEWSAALGFASDSDDRDGAYGRIGMSARR